jgi:hypothetical protein
LWNDPAAHFIVTTESPASDPGQPTPASPEPPTQEYEYDLCIFCGACDWVGVAGVSVPPSCANCEQLLLATEIEEEEFWDKFTEWDFDGVETPDEYVARLRNMRGETGSAAAPDSSTAEEPWLGVIPETLLSSGCRIRKTEGEQSDPESVSPEAQVDAEPAATSSSSVRTRVYMAPAPPPVDHWADHSSSSTLSW